MNDYINKEINQEDDDKLQCKESRDRGNPKQYFSSFSLMLSCLSLSLDQLMLLLTQ